MKLPDTSTIKQTLARFLPGQAPALDPFDQELKRHRDAFKDFKSSLSKGVDHTMRAQDAERKVLRIMREIEEAEMLFAYLRSLLASLRAKGVPVNESMVPASVGSDLKSQLEWARQAVRDIRAEHPPDIQALLDRSLGRREEMVLSEDFQARLPF